MRTVRLKLVLDEGQRDSLLRTMEAYTRAFDHAARWGFRNRVSNKFSMHREIYRGLREDVPELTSALIISACRAACVSLKRVKMKRVPKRRPHASVAFVWKEAKVWFESGRVSIASVEGRIHGHVAQSEYSRSFSSWRVKSSILVYEKRTKLFYLNLQVEKDTPPIINGDVLGIDRGLKNVAVCSNNAFFSSSRINATRGRYAWNRAQLQALGTRSAKRRLRKQSGRERQFVTCENHRISREIVNTDYAVFAMEDLSRISHDRLMTKPMRCKLSTWAHYQLETFIQYKAEELGKSIIKLDPSLTSQTCSRCGWIDNDSRQGNVFHCVRCDFEVHADLNASRNIARLGKSELGRLHADQPYATGSEGDHSGVHSRS